jgi:hypothetical protein
MDDIKLIVKKLDVDCIYVAWGPSVSCCERGTEQWVFIKTGNPLTNRACVRLSVRSLAGRWQLACPSSRRTVTRTGNRRFGSSATCRGKVLKVKATNNLKNCNRAFLWCIFNCPDTVVDRVAAGGVCPLQTHDQ